VAGKTRWSGPVASETGSRHVRDHTFTQLTDEMLRRRVVQFLRDPLAFFLLKADEVPGELFPFLLQILALRDVGNHTNKPRWFTLLCQLVFAIDLQPTLNTPRDAALVATRRRASLSRNCTSASLRSVMSKLMPKIRFPL
jgi:hypothetical protein